MTELGKLMGRLGENDYAIAQPDGSTGTSEAGVPEEDDVDRLVESAFAELERRMYYCGPNGYPYEVTSKGYTLATRTHPRNCRHLIYHYLLLATRLNMATDRRHADIDGADLFEKVAAGAARGYLGGRAKSLVFGTLASGFGDRVSKLCAQLHEGGRFVSRHGGETRTRDDRLDVVVWKDFSDRRRGKLIAFGQCKTGTSYRDSLTHLQPDSFVAKWMADPIRPDPIRMFFVSEALPDTEWGRRVADAGLLFDRCRLIDYCDRMDHRVMRDVATWTNAAATKTNLPKLSVA